MPSVRSSLGASMLPELWLPSTKFMPRGCTPRACSMTLCLMTGSGSLSEGVMDIAWQVGHLAMAQYRLAIDNVLVSGHRPTDDALISPEFLKQLGKDSIPRSRSGKEPSPRPSAECSPTPFLTKRSTRSPKLPTRSGTPELLRPHSLFNTKLGSILWCSRHEMVHAGQIGLLAKVTGAEAAVVARSPITPPATRLGLKGDDHRCSALLRRWAGRTATRVAGAMVHRPCDTRCRRPSTPETAVAMATAAPVRRPWPSPPSMQMLGIECRCGERLIG